MSKPEITPQPTSDAPLLRVQDLSVEFKSGEQAVRAVNHLSFDLNANETLAIVGESGSGKSVSALSILRLLPYPLAQHPSGKILFKGRDLLRSSEQEMRAIRGERISMIFQEPMTSLNPLHSIERQIGETLHLHKGLGGREARERIIELLTLVGIPDPAARLGFYPHQLSGGQKQRVMIAMALANEPDLLIADEPTTALDVTVQKQVLELLKSLQRRLNMAILLITHDLNIVRHYADRVLVMQKGDQVEEAPCNELFHRPRHAYTRQLIEADPKGCPQALAEDARSILRTHNLNVWFAQKKTLFGRPLSWFKAAQDINLELKAGETLGIVGESGSGKTTIGLALLKLLSSRGGIEFDGRAIEHLDQRQFRPLRRDIQIVFQDPFGSLSPRMSVAEIIGEGLEIHKVGDAASREQAIIDVLKEVELDPGVRHRYPHEFSGGQRQRIAIARALVLQPKLIILDEPTSALDRTVQCQVVKLLQGLQQKYQISYIFISHDLAVVKALSHRILVLKNGQVVEQGPSQQIFSAPQAAYTRSLIEAAFYHEAKTPDTAQCEK